MLAPEIINLNSLTSPIFGDNPCGLDIRQNPSPTSPYKLIKDARAAARAAERSSLFDGKSDTAQENWRKILELAPEILKNETKDLEVATWFAEALIRKHGFQGLREGFTLIRKLIELYWETLYPMPDEDGMETRISPLIGLNGEGTEGILIPPIRNTAITESFDFGSFTVWHYKQALNAQKISDDDLRDKKIKHIGFSIADIESAIEKSSNLFFFSIRNDLTTAIDEYRKIGELLDAYCGTADSPPNSHIINALEDALSVVKYLGKHKFPEEIIIEPQPNTISADNGESTQNPIENTTPSDSTELIRARADAFKQLNNIADFFRKTEPHSPISYAIDRAIKWGDMPLNELIKELIPDTSSRDVYSSLTGVNINDK